MPEIKWIGVIMGNSADFEDGELPENARKLESPKTITEMQLKAIPFIIPSMLVMTGAMFYKNLTADENIVHPLYIILGFFIGALMLIVHEFLHAIVYPKGAKVYVGIDIKSAAAVALASYPMKRSRFIFMCLLPYILGIIPITAFLLLPPDMKELLSLLFGISIMGLISPYADAYNVFSVMRQTGKNSLIQFCKDDIYSID